MHKHVTHNRCHAIFADFKAAILTFLREEVPRKWDVYCDQVTDNFRLICWGRAMRGMAQKVRRTLNAKKLRSASGWLSADPM
jgi:hypothetical protein